MSQIVVDIIGLGDLRGQLKELKLSERKRKRILRKVAARVIRDSRKRVRTQTDLQGVAFKKRWKKRSDRRKMLSLLIKQVDVLSNNGMSAKIGWRRLSGYIAAKQQFGDSQTVTAKTVKKELSKRQQAEEAPAKPATKRQAVELKSLGYRSPGNRRKAAMSWVMNNLSVKQAGAIIRSMREKQGIAPKSTWHTVLPARSFLGATQAEIAQYIQEIFEDVNKEISRGIR